MLEIGEDVAAFGKMFADAGGRLLALFRAVAGLAVAVVGEVGGEDVGGVPVFGFGDAECGVAGCGEFAR